MATNGKDDPAPITTAEAISERKPDGRFKPGVSGNPGGRPAVAREFRALLQEEVAKNLEVLVAIRDNPDAKDTDRIACIKELNDRALGRAPQAVEHSGAIGSGNGPAEHKPDMASRLAGLRERVMAETAERQAAVTTAVTVQDGQTIQ
jgi:Family of unknown function (DUF5681)